MGQAASAASGCRLGRDSFRRCCPRNAVSARHRRSRRWPARRRWGPSDPCVGPWRRSSRRVASARAGGPPDPRTVRGRRGLGPIPAVECDACRRESPAVVQPRRLDALFGKRPKVGAQMFEQASRVVSGRYRLDHCDVVARARAFEAPSVGQRGSVISLDDVEDWSGVPAPAFRGRSPDVLDGVGGRVRGRAASGGVR